jgi:hypothetical protein
MRYLIPILLIAVLVGCEAMLVPAHHGPPSHAPAHGYYKKHVYHYYPDLEIYWSVELGTYAVIQGGRWVVVRERPAILASAHRHVVIKVDSRDPWRNHAHYKKAYPPGQLKKHARGKGKGRKK